MESEGLSEPGSFAALLEADDWSALQARKRVQFRELDAVGWLAARLVELCERYGEVTPQGTIIFLPLTLKRIVVHDIDALRQRSS